MTDAAIPASVSAAARKLSRRAAGTARGVWVGMTADERSSYFRALAAKRRPKKAVPVPENAPS